VVAAGLAVAASVMWGCADFFGGLFSRRLSVATVVLVGQGAALTAVLVVAWASGGVDARAVEIGLLAGLFGGVGLAAYYRALAVGTMSIVAPIAACGALVSVALALAEGERPPLLALGGALVAVAGAVAASLPERRIGEAHREALAFAVLTAFMFGALLYTLGRASDEGGALSALLGSRVGSLAILLGWLLAVRPPLAVGRPTLLVAVALAGTMAACANGLYGAAAERGLISIASVIASLYPVMTVVLAHAVLGERIARVQKGGIVAAMTGVALSVLGTSGS
jgi:drug/metabolite transporter (DMT)-like permease